MTATFYVGDAITVMNRLPKKSVDLILSSPPFLALRSYLPSDHPDKAFEGGSQSTPGEYLDWLLDVVEACARVLAPHGSLCFELGDTYSGSGGAGGDYAESGLRAGQPAFRQGYYDPNRGRAPRQASDYGETSYVSNSGGTGWPLAKSLSLIPESFRFAMVYGRNPHTGRTTKPWRLRNVIRWVRPNPPVGALGDKFRPATSELMVFCKSKDRFFDLDAVRHPQRTYNIDNDNWTQRPIEGRGDAGKQMAAPLNEAGAPPLDWWNIPPGGYVGAHYAVWPPELLIKPIKAMCPEKVCRQCGEPSRRIVEREPYYTANGERTPGGGRGDGIAGIPAIGMGHTVASRIIAESWTDCGHDDYRPGRVLDPFGGSGTTALVATGHGRDCVLIDLDERNYALALDRVGPFILTRGEVAA